jgi:signal transduction histidine kinase
VAAAVDVETETQALLRELEQLFRRRRGARAELEQVVPAARERALGIAQAAGGTREAAALAGVAFGGELLGALWLDRPWSREQVLELVEPIARMLQLAPELVSTALYLRVAREQRVMELPPHLAIETQLRMLHAFAPVEETSVWASDADGQLACLVSVGATRESRRAREIARSLLAGEPPGESERARLHGIPILRWERPVAALVVRAPAETRREALALAQEAAAGLSPLLQLDLLLDRSAARERALVESTERLLVRLGFDIHDGALQDLAALASDARLFQAQLAEVLEESERKELILGRVGDLEARVLAIDAELRELTQSLESPAAVSSSLPEAVAAEVQSFRAEAGIAAELEVRGDLEDLTASQTIALTRIVQEALSNVREHSAATRADVMLRGSKALLELEIRDDGCGFSVEERVVAAARGGHLGLVGMAERVRLLGGRLDVDSRPGGPTRIAARIPRWRPAAQRSEGAGAA